MARCHDKRVKCSECAHYAFPWDSVPVLKGIGVCRERNEVIISEDDADFYREKYKECFVAVVKEYEHQDIRSIEQKRMDKMHLSEAEQSVMCLWDDYDEKRRNIPPLDNIRIWDSGYRDVQKMLFEYFDAAAGVLVISNEEGKRR